jgi:hypothetical protein
VVKNGTRGATGQKLQIRALQKEEKKKKVEDGRWMTIQYNSETTF